MSQYPLYNGGTDGGNIPFKCKIFAHYANSNFEQLNLYQNQINEWLSNNDCYIYEIKQLNSDNYFETMIFYKNS